MSRSFEILFYYSYKAEEAEYSENKLGLAAAALFFERCTFYYYYYPHPPDQSKRPLRHLLGFTIIISIIISKGTSTTNKNLVSMVQIGLNHERMQEALEP